MSSAATAGDFGVEDTGVADQEAAALVAAVATEAAVAVSTSRSTTLPPAFLAPMAPPLRGVTPIASHETQRLQTYINDKQQLYTKLTPTQFQLCIEGRALVHFGDLPPST